MIAIRNMYLSNAKTHLNVRGKLNPMGYYSVNGFIGVPFTGPNGEELPLVDEDGEISAVSLCYCCCCIPLTCFLVVVCL